MFGITSVDPVFLHESELEGFFAYQLLQFISDKRTPTTISFYSHVPCSNLPEFLIRIVIIVNAALARTADTENFEVVT